MPLEEWHLSDSCYAVMNTPDTDTSRKTRSWIGAFGLMIADSPSEQTVRIPKARGSANARASEVGSILCQDRC